MTFVVTRLLAEGVRLFAGAIPIKVILGHYNIHLDYWLIVVILTALTLIYAFIGGIKAVVWVDVIQLSLYLGGAAVAAIVLLNKLPGDWMTQASDDGKFMLVDFTKNLLTSPYAVHHGGARRRGAVHGLARRGPADRAAADGDAQPA